MCLRNKMRGKGHLNNRCSPRLREYTCCTTSTRICIFWTKLWTVCRGFAPYSSHRKCTSCKGLRGPIKELHIPKALWNLVMLISSISLMEQIPISAQISDCEGNSGYGITQVCSSSQLEVIVWNKHELSTLINSVPLLLHGTENDLLLQLT